MSHLPLTSLPVSELTHAPFASRAAKFGRFLPRGVYAPLNTFYNDDESLDLETFKKHAQYVASAGGPSPRLTLLCSPVNQPGPDTSSSSPHTPVGLVALGSMGEGAYTVGRRGQAGN